MINYIDKDTLPSLKGGDMKITPKGRDKKSGFKKYFIDHAYRRADGKSTHITRTAIGSTELALKIAEMKKIADGSLISIAFHSCIALTLQENNGAGMSSVYKIIDKELGKYPVNKRFVIHYNDFILKLKNSGKSVNTISNYKSCIRTALNKAYNQGRIESIPIKDFEIEREFRDRVWTPKEKERIYNAMHHLESHLYWSVWFAERRPIRGRSDLWRLTDDNLVLVGKGAPYIRFRAQKTSKKVPRDTFLPLEGMEPLIKYFRQGRPKGCRLLFPRIEGDNWYPMGNPKRHWNTICDKAKVPDFHFHDLKHVAITHMLDSAYAIQDLKNLGIQFSDDMINKVYYNYNADKVLMRVNSSQETVLKEAV